MGAKESSSCSYSGSSTGLGQGEESGDGGFEGGFGVGGLRSAAIYADFHLGAGNIGAAMKWVPCSNCKYQYHVMSKNPILRVAQNGT